MAESQTPKLPFRRYFALTRGGILELTAFRMSMALNFVGNIIYMIVVYFLWSAIYESTPTGIVNGMTFSDTLIYLTLASAICSLVEVYLVWQMGRDIQSGQFSLYFTKPTDFFLYQFFNQSGNIATGFIVTFLPTFFIVDFLSSWRIPIGVNILFFAMSLIFSIIINFCIDFMIGTLCLYTQSFWGINMMKEVIVLLLSGATIPIAFFPHAFQTVVMYLPFQAIYNVPLQILISDSLSFADYGKYLGIQAFWSLAMIVLARLFFRHASKVITVNGG